MDHPYTKASPLGRLTVLWKQKQCHHSAPKLSRCQSNCSALCFFFSCSHSFKAVAAASKLSWSLAAFIKMLMELPSWHISMGQIHSPWPFFNVSVWLSNSIHQLLLNNRFFTHSCSLTIVVCFSFLLCFSFFDFLLCHFFFLAFIAFQTLSLFSISWGNGASVIKALGLWSDCHEFKSQHCQAVMVGPLSKALDPFGSWGTGSVPTFLASYYGSICEERTAVLEYVKIKAIFFCLPLVWLFCFLFSLPLFLSLCLLTLSLFFHYCFWIKNINI